MQGPLPAGLLISTQALTRMVEARAPGLRQQVENDRAELKQLEQQYERVILAWRATLPVTNVVPAQFTVPPPQVTRAPAPIRPITDRLARPVARRRRQRAVTAQRRAEMGAVLNKLMEDGRLSRRRLEELQTNRAKLYAEIDHAINRLAQAFCDAVIQMWVVLDATGEQIELPKERGSTSHGVDMLRTGRLELLGFQGRVVMREADFDRWLASEALIEESEQPGPPAISLAVNGADREFTLVDLTKPPAPPAKFSEKRLPKEGLHRATDEDCDVIIQLIAASDAGGKTNEPTIRKWGRYLLRQLLQADTTAGFIAGRFLDLHVELRRPGGNPSVLRG